MKHMRTGRNIGKRVIAPKFYIMDAGVRVPRSFNLETAIRKADTLGSNAVVYPVGKLSGAVHIGGYE